MSSKIVRNIDLNEKLMNQVISIAYGVDEPYVPHMSASIYSLLINNKEIKFKIYIIHSGISESDIKKIKKNQKLDNATTYNKYLSKGILSMDHEDFLMASKYFNKAQKIFPANKDAYCL